MASRCGSFRSFQAVPLTCMIVTVSGNLPHIDFIGCVSDVFWACSWWAYPNLLGCGNHPRWDILRLQAPPCLVGLHLDERAGLSSRSSLLSFSSVRHAALRFPLRWVNCSPWNRQTLQLYDALQSLERWVPLPFFFTGRFDVGQDVFPEQWLLVSSFKDPCLHRVVDNSLLLMVLSVPSLLPNFLGGRWGPLTRDLPSLQLWMPRPISFMQVSCCGWGNKVFSSTCVVTSRGFLSQSSPKVHGWMPAFQPSGSRVQAFVLARSLIWNFLGGGPNVSLCQLWGINGWTYPEFVHWVHQ